MDYLISIQDSINTVNNALMEWSCMEPWRDAKIVDSLHDIPPAQPADVVEVVRCGECKHLMADGRCFEFADDNIKPSASDYCSYGERRKE